MSPSAGGRDSALDLQVAFFKLRIILLISAMMIEIMAGKSAAVHGLVHDATPFRFSENDTAVEYFGKLLEQGGYNYYGTERMYSGIDGREMTADIFFGVVHYQRLRHMVSDKWQVCKIESLLSIRKFV